MKLRQYQRSVLDKCQYFWREEDVDVIMPVVPTGGGKTVIIGQAALEHDGDGFIMAHRSELVGQLSMALARVGMSHSIVASKEVRRTIQLAHYEQFGRSFITGRSDWHVGSVDTVIRRDIPKLRKGLVVQDEGHHTLKENKWGKALSLFPKGTKVLLPTATPCRADGKGLGVHTHGVAERLVMGPTARELINRGMLCDYEVLAPNTSDLDLTGVAITASGDYNLKQLAEAIKNSRQLVGDVVEHYMTYAHGRSAVYFAVNVEEATNLVKAFRATGVTAELLTGEDSEATRREVFRRFKSKDTLVLLNVDLFGEGLDIPGIEVVGMARPTDSFCLYSQQWGRALRLMIDSQLMSQWDTYTDEARLTMIAASKKPFAMILDHVGNLIRHEGPPDAPRDFSLDAPVKRRRGEVSPIVSCPKCLKPHDRIALLCPHCQHDRLSEARMDKVTKENIERVDGDLRFFTQEALEEMRRDIIKPGAPIRVPLAQRGTPAEIKIRRDIKRSQDANARLRVAMSYWAGLHRALNQEEKRKLFYHQFSIDPLTALSLKYGKSEPLLEQVLKSISARGYDLEHLHQANFKVDTSDWVNE